MTILLNPDLHSIINIDEHDQNGLYFNCYSYQPQYIELWSNLTTDKEWRSSPFTTWDETNHQVCVHISHLEPGKYEYTLRYKTRNTSWSWYGLPGQNGRVHIMKQNADIRKPFSVENTQQLQFIDTHHNSNVELYHYKTRDNLPLSTLSLGKIGQEMLSFVAFLRKGSCWITPITGQSNFDKHSSHEKWQSLLYHGKQDGRIYLCFAMGTNVDCWFSPETNHSLYLNVSSLEGGNAHVLICSTLNKHRIISLFQTALSYFHTVIKGNVKQDDLLSNHEDQLNDALGYCTWNAFADQVTIDSLQQAMESLESNEIPVQYLLIDDGWQSVEKKRMTSMDACQKKFPGGLKKNLSELKAKFQTLKHIGVWHALWGYWDGIDEAFAKENTYGFTQIKDNNGNLKGILPDPVKFYQDFYQFLQDAGVDFVKVDNQGAFQDLVLNSSEVFTLWNNYRDAMVQSADIHMKYAVRHCMSLAPHVLLNPILSHKKVSVVRNSDDFFPNEDDSHTWHIFANAINTLWTSCYSNIVNDWDMFQSKHPFAKYHASSRAISGGPIYITDVPNRHDAHLLRKLVGQTRSKGYTILRSVQAPLPTYETIFGNVIENQSLLCLYNTHQEENTLSTLTEFEYGISGFWNTGTAEKLGVLSTDIFDSRVPVLKSAVAYVVSGVDQGKVALLASKGHSSSKKMGKSSISVRVAGFSSSLVSLSYVQTLGELSVACLGLIDKFNGTRAIFQTRLKKPKHETRYAEYEAILTHRSNCCAFWFDSTTRSKSLVPQQALLDGKKVIWNYSKEAGVLKVDMMSVELDASTESTFKIHIII